MNGHESGYETSGGDLADGARGPDLDEVSKARGRGSKVIFII